MGGLWAKNVFTSDTCSSFGLSAGDQIQIDTPKQTYVNALSGTIVAHTCTTTQQSDRAVNICTISTWEASTNMQISLNAITQAGTTNSIASISPSAVGGGCDDTWDTCAGSDATDCLTCPANSHRPNSSSGGSQWDCDDGWYRSGGDPGKCDDQWHNCKECTGSNANDCTNCYSPQTLNNGLCECPMDYFADTLITWQSCSGASSTECVQCSGYLWIPQVGQCLEQNCDSSWDTCISITANDCITCTIGEYLEQVGAGPAGTCNSCGDRWATCQVPGDSQCDTWISNAQKTSGLPQDSCECSEGYFWDGSIWSPCSTDCKAWSSFAVCTDCKANATLLVNTCICNLGYYPNPGPGSCSQWGDRCATCSAGGVSQWDTWISNSQKTSGLSQDSCDCSEGYFWDGSIWDQCSSTCKAWSTQIVCIDCHTNAAVDASNNCVCINRFYPNTGADNCALWGDRCATCQAGGVSQCDTCIANSQKTSGFVQDSCDCNERYYWDGNIWDQCSIACKVWSGPAANECIECVDHASKNADNEWVCIDGYVENLTDGSCSSCKPDWSYPVWKKCDDQNDINQCTECYENAIINSDHWVCASGFAGQAIGLMSTLDHDATNCEPCASAWFTWAVNDKNSCQSCVDNAELNNDTCTCSPGFSLEVNRCLVIICHRTWFSCIGTEVTQWSSCHNNATLNNGSCICNENFIMDTTGLCIRGCYANAYLVNNICVCRDGYFPNPDAASCISCDTSCLTCSNTHSWDSCPVNSFLLDSGLWESCEDKTYYDSEQESCLPWLPFCAKCTDEYSCDTCVDTGNQYMPGECCGDNHFRDDSQYCHKCAVLCQQCSSLQDCASCVDFAVMISGICECEWGYHEFEENCEEDGVAPDLSINVASANVVQLSFDKQILQQLSTSNTEVSLEGIDPDLYTYQITEVEPGVKYEIVFDFADSVQLNETKVDIQFREKITDLKGNGNEESQYEAILPDMDSKDSQNSSSDNNSDQLSSDEQAVSEGLLVAVQTVVTAGILSGYATGDLSATWGLVNTIQILAYIPLMDSQMPQMLQETLSGLIDFELVPNMFEYVLDDGEFVEQEPYDLAKGYGFDNNVFLINCGGILVNALVILLILPIMLLLGKCKNSKVANWAKSTVYSYKWCFFIRLWIELHLEVGIAAYFQFLTPSWSNSTMIVNTLLGYFFFVLGFMSFPLILAFLVCNRRLIQERDEEFYKTYGSLFEEFQNSMGTVSTLFYSWFFLRRSVYVVTLIVLRHYVGAQLIINLMHTLLTLMFLIIYRPYTSKANNYVQIFTECASCFIFALCASFHLQGARDNSEMIKWTVLVLISLIVFVNLVLTLVGQILLIKAMCEKLCRRKSVKVDPIQPSEIQETKSNLSITLEETEQPFPFQQTDEIIKPKKDTAKAVARRVKMSYQSTPSYINFKRPNPSLSNPIIDQQSIASLEIEEPELPVESLCYKNHNQVMAQKVARRVQNSYASTPSYINSEKVDQFKSFPIKTSKRITLNDIAQIDQPQEQGYSHEYERPEDDMTHNDIDQIDQSQEQEYPHEHERSEDDIAQAVARRIQNSYSARPSYINFEPVLHNKNQSWFNNN